MPPAGLVSASAVTKRFGNLLVNEAIDLEVAPGEVVGLLGANGAGKTTFMRLLLGLLAPTSGTVRLLGRPPSRSIRRRVGYVPQGLGLYEDLTVAENLAFAASAFHTGPAELEDPSLQAHLHTLTRDLPLGLRRRVAFAAALGHHPEVLVLDEPTSGVDPLARSRLWEAIRDRAETGVGVVVSTHYMEEVEHCDRVAVLVSGRVAAAGTAETIVGGRRALQITTPTWDAAFQALDAAGVTPSLHGRKLRVMGTDADRIAQVLGLAGVTAQLADVPASFEEAFVALVGRGGTPG